MSIDEHNASKPAASAQSSRCEHTGLSKPECHCRECMRELVSRFRPGRAA